MVGSALKKYAKAHGLRVNGGFAYGTLHGYNLALDDGPNIKRMVLFTRFPDEAQKAAFDAALNESEAATYYRIQSREYSDNMILLVFKDKMGTMTLIEEFADRFLPQLAQYGALPDVCSHCGASTGGSGKWVLVNGLPFYMHESCLHSTETSIRSSEERVKEDLTGSYLAGFFGALLGGLLGSALWAGLMYVGFIAGLVGFVIGFLAEKGYRLLKGKEGKGKLFILIAVILLCVAFGTLLGEYVVTAKAMHEEGLSHVPTMDFFLYLLREEPEFRTAIVKDFLLGLLFAGLGVFGLLARTRRETADTKIKILP